MNEQNEIKNNFSRWISIDRKINIMLNIFRGFFTFTTEKGKKDECEIINYIWVKLDADRAFEHIVDGLLFAYLKKSQRKWKDG